MGGRDYWEQAIRQEMRRSGCSRDEASHRVNAQVFGGDKAEEIRQDREAMAEQTEVALEHLADCAELAPGHWECDPECPIWRRGIDAERENKKWRWGTIV